LTNILILDAAGHRLDEVYRYTLEEWGEEQAERYIRGLFDAFGRIEKHEIFSRPIPAEYGVDGYWFRYEKHFVYWKKLSTGQIGIVTVLHERMFRADRLKEDFGVGPH
jgi:toxin ParE1/3/4